MTSHLHSPNRTASKRHELDSARSSHAGYSPVAICAGIEESILHRMNPSTQLSANGARFSAMSLVEMGREVLTANGVENRGLSRLEAAGLMLNFRAAGMGGTSDFVGLLSNVANKRLREAYEPAPASFKAWARRAPDAHDFKPITVVNLSGMPDLLRTNEHGEFKYGAMTDGKETYSMINYGRIVSITRQAIINDDLRGFDRLLTGFGYSAARLENRLVYAQLTANAALSDGIAVFHASHANLLSGGGSALALASLADGRTLMRKQKGLQSEELSLAPAHLIVPASLEQTAYQLTSAQYVPAQASNINEFRQGGRTSLQPVVEALLDDVSATAWYLAANTGAVDTVEYCYLAGQDAPVVDVLTGFEVDGIEIRCRHDFATKVIDHRGLVKSVGA